MQTFGTWLQLSGSAITGFGLLYAWLTVTGRLRRWGATAAGLVVQLRSAAAKLGTGGNTGSTVEASFTLDVPPQIHMAQTPSDAVRLSELESDHAALRDRVENLADEINDAITTALHDLQDLTNAARVRDIVPALFGIAVSIAGYACQLCA